MEMSQDVSDYRVALYDIDTGLLEYQSRTDTYDSSPVLCGGSMAWLHGDGTGGKHGIWFFGRIVCTERMPGDINIDCKVNFHDFALMATDWLRCERWGGLTCQ